MASGSSLHQTTRPRFSRVIRPASARVARCFEMAASEISKGWLCHVGHGHVVFQKHGQDRPPRPVGEGGEDGVEAGRGRAGHAATIAGAAELSTDGLNMKSRAKPDPIAARVVSSWYKCTHLQCVAWEMEGRFVA